MKYFLPCLVMGGVDENCVSLAHVEQVIRDTKTCNEQHGLDTGLMLRIDSPGGNSAEALKICDAIRGSGLNTWALIEGSGHSGASVIASACMGISARPWAEILIHDPRYFEDDDVTVKVAARLSNQERAEIKRVRNLMLNIYQARNPKLTRAEIADLMAKDTILDAWQALDLGLIDEILPRGAVSRFQQDDPDPAPPPSMESNRAVLAAAAARLAEMAPAARAPTAQPAAPARFAAPRDELDACAGMMQQTHERLQWARAAGLIK